MSIESLKQQARKHEQNEDWKKALDQYRKALAQLARDDQVDIGLYNRVGDLFVRVGQLDDAVEHYENAVELYREAYLPNNAIAVCKKVIRNVPDRHRAYLVIGQIRAEQGFLPDARTNFLTYAERMQRSGDMDESFRALVEFCDLAPDDVGVRITVAEQMVANDRKDEGVEQMLIVYRHYKYLGETQQAEDMKSRILAIDPAADFDTIPPMSGFRTGSGISDDPEAAGGLEDITFGSTVAGGTEKDISFATQEATEDATAARPDEADDGSGTDEADDLLVDDAEMHGAGDAETDATATDDDGEMTFDIHSTAAADQADAGDEPDDEAEADPLPTMEVDFGQVDFADEDEEAVELPMMSFSDDDGEHGPAVAGDEAGEDDAEDLGEPLPMMEFGSETEPGETPPPIDLDTAPGPEDVTAGLSLSEEFSKDQSVGGEAVEDALEDARSSSDVDSASTAPTPTQEPPTPTGEPATATLEPATPEDASNTVEPPPSRTARPDDVTSGPVEPAAEPVTEETAPSDGDESAPDDGGYVDLGAMILGNSPVKKSTRFTVAYEEPSGDEEADFAKMLSQFKDKVSENLDATDVRAHYDLGTAYKEMGLLDEAIGSFQAALRASADHLPTYELMGQTFIEMGQPEAAVRTLERAIRSATTVEDELVGIYYYLGRAHEALENDGSAVEFYDRVFALDINFADVTERLRALR